MNFSRIINIIPIVVGGAIVLIYNIGENENEYLLIGGIVLLMFGLYRISRNTPSRLDNPQEESFVKTEKDED